MANNKIPENISIPTLYKMVVPWLERQGIAIVVLIAACAVMFFYTKKLDIKISVLEIQVQTLNDRLIDCEKSKLDILRYDHGISSSNK